MVVKRELRHMNLFESIRIHRVQRIYLFDTDNDSPLSPCYVEHMLSLMTSKVMLPTNSKKSPYKANKLFYFGFSFDRYSNVIRKNSNKVRLNHNYTD